MGNKAEKGGWARKWRAWGGSGVPRKVSTQGVSTIRAFCFRLYLALCFDSSADCMSHLNHPVIPGGPHYYFHCTGDPVAALKELDFPVYQLLNGRTRALPPACPGCFHYQVNIPTTPRKEGCHHTLLHLPRVRERTPCSPLPSQHLRLFPGERVSDERRGGGG